MNGNRSKMGCARVCRNASALTQGGVRSDQGAPRGQDEKQGSLSLYIKDERLCAFPHILISHARSESRLKTSAGWNYRSRYFFSYLRFLAQRALASRESFFLAARLIVGLVPLTCTAALLVGTSARR